jgi:hypothetical protein
LLEGYFRNVEVINLGVGGFGVDQELLFLRSEGFRYEPDLVLAYVAHYGGHRHMHTRRFGKNKPRFSLVDGGLILENSPVSRVGASDTVRGDGRNTFRENVSLAGAGVTSSHDAGIPRRIHRALRRRSRAYEIFRNGLVRLLAPNTTETPERHRLQDRENLENQAFRKELFELGEALICAMHDESSQHGAAFVLVTQIEALHTAALDREITSLDVSKPLSNPALALPEDLAHINEPGNGVLAWVIAEFLQANHLVPSRHLKK